MPSPTKAIWLVISYCRQIKSHPTSRFREANQRNFPKNSRYYSVINSHLVCIGFPNTKHLSQIIASRNIRLLNVNQREKSVKVDDTILSTFVFCVEILRPIILYTSARFPQYLVFTIT